MFIDTSFNTVPTVLANLHQSFREAAVRCFEYNRSLSKVKPTHSRLLISKLLPRCGKGCPKSNRRAHQYLHLLSIRPRLTLLNITDQRPSETVDSIIALAHVMLQRRTRTKASQNVERVRSVISRRQIQW